MAGTTLISSLTFTQFADTTARIFYAGKDLPLVKDLNDLMSIYMVDYIPRSTGEQRVYDEIDGETYAHFKAQGADATKTQAIAGYSTTMTVRRFAAEIDISYEAREYGKEQQIISKLTSLSTFCPQKMALDLTHRFTFATATSYTDMDGESVSTAVGDALALASASHTLTGSSSTYSTIITGNPQFSQGGFETAKNQSNTQILNNFGERRILNFNTVICSDQDAATLREIRQLLNSTADIDAAQSGVANVYANMFKLNVLPRLATTATGAYDSTKAKYWAYLAVGEFEAHLGVWEEPHLKMPAPSNNGEDAHNDNWTFGARCGYGITIPSPKGFLLSTGLGV